MPSITAKQVKNSKNKKGKYPNLKENREVAHDEVKEMSTALKTWDVGFLDIETTGLGADFGFVLGACILSGNTGKTATFRIDDYKNYKNNLCDDKQLVLDICEEVDKYDVIVTYNGDNFDLPFLDTRLAIHGCKKRISLVHSIDLLPIVKRKLRLHSNRLDTVGRALGLTQEKTPLLPQTWIQASHGSKEDLNYIMQHCEKDVLVLQEAFVTLKQFIDSVFRRR